MKRVFEAIYVKVLVSENEFLRPNGAGMTPATHALFNLLYPKSATTPRVGRETNETRIVVEIIVAAMRAAGAIARGAHARYLQRRQARAIYDALRYLDDRTPRDLGFERSEIKSLAARVTGEAHTPAGVPY